MNAIISSEVTIVYSIDESWMHALTIINDCPLPAKCEGMVLKIGETLIDDLPDYMVKTEVLVGRQN